MKLGQQNSKPKLGLLRQLLRSVAAPDVDRRRIQVVHGLLAAQPIEVCEARVMLSATSDTPDESEVDFRLLTDVDFERQLHNAESFAHGIVTSSNVVSVTTLLNGVPVQLQENSRLDSPRDFSLDGPFGGNWLNTTEREFSTEILPEGLTERTDFAGLPEISDAGEAGPEEPVEPAPELEDHTTDASDFYRADWNLVDLSSDGSNYNAPSSTPTNTPASTPSTAGAVSDSIESDQPTTLTTIIETDDGLVVLHQTTDDDEAVAVRSSSLNNVKQVVNRLIQQNRDERSQEILDARIPGNDVETGASEQLELDSVFADSSLLLSQLDFSSTETEQAEFNSEVVNAGPVKEESLAATVRSRTAAPSQLSGIVVRGLTDEFEVTLGPGRRTRRDQSWIQSAAHTGIASQRALAEGRLVLQLFPALAARDDKRSDAELLLEQARDAAHPVNASPDLRNEELLLIQSLSVAYGGELWNTVPLLIPQLPPNVPVIESLAATLLHSINPRGPPASDLPEGFSRHEAIRLQHSVLKHSIAPRSPSIGFFN